MDRQSGLVFDELLIVLVLRGHRGAGEQLCRRWHPRLLRTARRLLQNDDQALDVVQETWIGIARGLPRLRDSSRFPAWAFNILRRRCADRIAVEQRTRVRTTSLPDAPDNSVLAAPTGAADERIALDRAFAALSPDHRMAAVLYFCEGLTVPEVADATGVPLGTAKSRIFHARKHLKTLLEGEAK